MDLIGIVNVSGERYRTMMVLLFIFTVKNVHSVFRQKKNMAKTLTTYYSVTVRTKSFCMGIEFKKVCSQMQNICV